MTDSSTNFSNCTDVVCRTISKPLTSILIYRKKALNSENIANFDLISRAEKQLEKPLPGAGCAPYNKKVSVTLENQEKES